VTLPLLLLLGLGRCDAKACAASAAAFRAGTVWRQSMRWRLARSSRQQRPRQPHPRPQSLKPRPRRTGALLQQSPSRCAGAASCDGALCCRARSSYMGCLGFLLRARCRPHAALLWPRAGPSQHAPVSAAHAACLNTLCIDSLWSLSRYKLKWVQAHEPSGSPAIPCCTATRIE